MKSDIQFLEVTKHDRALVGKQEPGKRIYRQSGPMEESGEWFNRLMLRFPSERFVSPGGVSMFAPVSRAAVYLRINTGKLTTFCYYPSETAKTLFGGIRKVRQSPFMYIPVSECKAWGDELRKRFAADEPQMTDRQFHKLDDEISDWPKHKGKVSPPKWKQKLAASRGRAVKRK